MAERRNAIQLLLSRLTRFDVTTFHERWRLRHERRINGGRGQGRRGDPLVIVHRSVVVGAIRTPSTPREVELAQSPPQWGGARVHRPRQPIRDDVDAEVSRPFRIALRVLPAAAWRGMPDGEKLAYKEKARAHVVAVVIAVP